MRLFKHEPNPALGSFSWALPAAVVAWLAVVGNWPLWWELIRLGYADSPRGIAFMAGFALAVMAGTSGLCAVFAWPRMLRIALSFWTLVTALSAHYMAAYHVVIDTSMLANVLQTDVREVRDLLSWQLIFSLVLVAGPPLWWIWRRPLKCHPWWTQFLHNCAALCVSLLVMVLSVWLVFQDFSSTMRNHKQLRFMINPLNTAFAVVDWAFLQGRQRPAGLQAIGLDAKVLPRSPGSLPPVLVLVVGETARASSFAVNGYARPTTPRLSQAMLDGELVNFSQVQSCGTSTAESLPCMFSHLGRTAYAERPANYENLLDVLHKAGLAVFWIDNQSGCKGLCDRIGHTNTSELGQAPWCSGQECLDEIMLERLQERITNLPQERRQQGVVLVMHQMGSHGPAYFKRSPVQLKPFQPECQSVQLQDCPREQVVNAYDNSIVYTDHFLGRVIDWLSARQHAEATAMLYVSDHGESLGEGNLYLHGLPYAIAPQEQKHVPMVLWMSRSYQRQFAVHQTCLTQQSGKPISHDVLFHSMMGLAGVRSSEYRPELDIIATCQPGQR